MATRSVTLTGWKAVAAIAVVAAFGLFRLSQQAGTLDTQGREVLTTWLAAEYTRSALRGIEQTGRDAGTAAKLLDAQAIDFRSLSARGRGEDVIVRAEVRVAGRTPPDGRSVRYFRMAYRLGTGWSYRREATAFAYYTKLW